VSALASGDITRILATLSDGDRSSAAELLPLVYHELRSLADRFMRGEPSDHTLQATAVVHEAYLRLVRGEPKKWNNRAHFFRVAAGVMRHILVDHARGRGRVKRGGNGVMLPLDEAVALFEERALDLVALDEALEKLAALDKRKARVVELRFFAGLGVEETAETLEISPRAVKSDWQFAKLWLLREIAKE
jgi:RNA polymerase sigma factor (TIGR02999 family)